MRKGGSGTVGLRKPYRIKRLYAEVSAFYRDTMHRKGGQLGPWGKGGKTTKGWEPTM